MKNITLLCLLSFTVNFFAQVGINTTNPSAGSILDIDANDKGILIPRISIPNLNNIAPVTGGSTESLLVYNTNTTTGVGFYYWNDSRWVAIDSGRNWNLTGNAGTNAGTNFLGTTDNIALRFRTNNFERFTISQGTTEENGGRLLAHTNGTETEPIYSWSADTNTGIWRADDDQLAFSTNGTQRARINNNGSFTFNSTTYLQDLYRFECDISTTSGDAMAVYNTGGNGVNQWTLNAYNSTNDGGVIYGFASNTNNDNMAVNGVNAGATGLGVRGFTSSTVNNIAIGVQGTSNNSNHYAVYGNIPTTGLWTGFGGLFTGGLGYANGIYNLSDKSFKKNIRKIDNALDMVLRMEGKKYEMNSPYPNLTFREGDNYGFIAQELELVLPEAVVSKKLPAEMVNTEKESKILNSVDAKMVDYITVVPILVEAMKEQQEQIKKLEKRIEELEKK